MTEIHGTCDDRFAAVRDAFAGNFAAGSERGASVHVTVGGEPVVDLWAGDADGEGRPWERDTIVNVWSTTKTMSALVLLMLADRGQLDLDAPVAEVWPEFAVNGKERITPAHILGHTAGLPGWEPAITADTLYDHEATVAVLEQMAPWWEPGTASGYHAISQGYLEDEIVRRVTGRTLGTFFREEVAEPLGADFHIGLPESEEHRVGVMDTPSVGLGGSLDNAGASLDDLGVGDASLALRALGSARITGAECNTREWRAAEIPAAGGTGNARSVSRIHSAIANGGSVDGVKLLSPEGVERIFVEQAHNADLVLGAKLRMGTGFGLVNDMVPLGPNPRTCFWAGWGGSLAVIDVDAGVTATYVMNKMAADLLGDLRGGAVCVTAIGIANA